MNVCVVQKRFNRRKEWSDLGDRGKAHISIQEIVSVFIYSTYCTNKLFFVD